MPRHFHGVVESLTLLAFCLVQIKFILPRIDIGGTQLSMAQASSVAFRILITCAGLLNLADSFLPTQQLSQRMTRPVTLFRGNAALAAVAENSDNKISFGRKKKPAFKVPGTCDSDWECEANEFCCDYLLFKMCCSDGKNLLC